LIETAMNLKNIKLTLGKSHIKKSQITLRYSDFKSELSEKNEPFLVNIIKLRIKKRIKSVK